MGPAVFSLVQNKCLFQWIIYFLPSLQFDKILPKRVHWQTLFLTLVILMIIGLLPWKLNNNRLVVKNCAKSLFFSRSCPNQHFLSVSNILILSFFSPFFFFFWWNCFWSLLWCWSRDHFGLFVPMVNYRIFDERTKIVFFLLFF